MTNLMITLAQQYIFSALSTFVLLSLLYVLFNIILEKYNSKTRIQLSKRVNKNQLIREIKLTFISLFVNILLSGIILYFDQLGYTKLYDDTFQYGLGYEVFIVILVILVSDTWFYWIHRAIHHPRIYKYIHAVHHQSLDVNVFSSNSFHWIESLLLTLFIVPMAFLVPISSTALGIAQGLGLFNNLKSHLGYEYYPKFFSSFPFNGFVTSTNHNLHHTQYNGNYGLMFRFWDVLCRTEIKDTQSVFKQIHDRKNVIIKDNSQFQTLTISKITKETDDTCSIYFKPQNKEFYEYLPGQYLNIRVKINSQYYERSFSLSSSPAEDKFLRITVKLNGIVTHYFNNEAKVGDQIECLLPMGDFGYKPNKNNQKHYLMVAGGSGITPIFSMIKSILFIEQKSMITLFYSNRTEKSIIFDLELQELSQSYPKNLVIKNFISGKNRLGLSDISEVISQYPDTQVYICGPNSLKSAAKEYLAVSKVSNDSIHTEDFVDGFVSMFSQKSIDQSQ